MNHVDDLALWQHEFDVIRSCDHLRLGRFTRAKLHVLPAWAGFLHNAFGAAFVSLTRIYVDRRILGAPAEVRQYLLLHEWGHVVSRHNRVGMVSAGLLFFVYGPNFYLLTHHHQPDPTLAPVAVVGLAAALAQFILSVWMMSDARELEADAYAASVIGAGKIMNGMGWIAQWSGKGWTSSRRKRRAALWKQVQEASLDPMRSKTPA